MAKSTIGLRSLATQPLSRLLPTIWPDTLQRDTRYRGVIDAAQGNVRLLRATEVRGLIFHCNDEDIFGAGYYPQPKEMRDDTVKHATTCVEIELPTPRY